MNYKSFNLGDWIGHISGVIEDETTLDGNEMRDLVEFLTTLNRSENPNKCNERLINEYISKVGCCDECFASVYCTVNGLRESRVPQDYCVKNIEKYFGDKASPTGAESEDKE